MRARKLILAIVVLLVVAAGSGLGFVVYMLKIEPDFYLQCDVPESKERKKKSAEFLGLFGQLAGYIADHRGKWQICFTQSHINSYFMEDFIRLGDAAHLQRQGISEPRVVFENDRLRLAFRYGSSLWSTVFSFDLRTWLAPEEPNVIALEFLSRNAGALPISAKSFLDQISSIARRNKIEVVWFRYNGNPVALLHLTTGRDRASAQLQHLHIEGGKLTIGGISFEPGQPFSHEVAVEANQEETKKQ